MEVQLGTIFDQIMHHRLDFWISLPTAVPRSFLSARIEFGGFSKALKPLPVLPHPPPIPILASLSILAF